MTVTRAAVVRLKADGLEAEIANGVATVRQYPGGEAKLAGKKLDDWIELLQRCKAELQPNPRDACPKCGSSIALVKVSTREMYENDSVERVTACTACGWKA
jgi:hypothetical protein